MTNQNHYLSSFAKHGSDIKSLGWKDEKAAFARYNALLDTSLGLKNKTILDVGCGFGDLIKVIEISAKNFNYTGVDILPEFVKIAKNKYPKYKFLSKDYFGNPIENKFDVIFCSGALNSNIANAIAYRKQAIKTMWDHASVAVAFNMAGAYPQPKNKNSYRVYYADSLEIVQFCLTLTPKLIYKQGYSSKHNDFTVIMFK